VPTQAKAKLHYVVMLACAIATEERGEIDLNRQDAAYMTVFMKELNARAMRPVVAGWDVFITAAPHRPKTAKAEDAKVFSHGGDDEIGDLRTQHMVGRKIVRRTQTKFETVSNEYRKVHKHLYRIVDGKLRVGLGTWSHSE
jgi:hypothetical protein